MRSPRHRRGAASSHGGARVGAGRKNLSGRHAHLRRPKMTSRHPLLVSFLFHSSVRSMRAKRQLLYLKRALGCAHKWDLRINQYALHAHRVHFIVEPRHRSQLMRAMKSFAVSCAMNMRRDGHRHIFNDRYHLLVLKTGSMLKKIRNDFFKKLHFQTETIDIFLQRPHTKLLSRVWPFFSTA